MRDSVALLDQLATFGSGTIADLDAARLLGGLDSAFLGALLAAILGGRTAEIGGLVGRLEDEGWDPRHAYNQLLAYCRDALHLALSRDGGARARVDLPEEEAAALAVTAREAGYENLLRLLQQLLASETTVRRSESAGLALEIALLRAAELPKLTRVEELLAGAPGGAAVAARPPRGTAAGRLCRRRSAPDRQPKPAEPRPAAAPSRREPPPEPPPDPAAAAAEQDSSTRSRHHRRGRRRRGGPLGGLPRGDQPAQAVARRPPGRHPPTSLQRGFARDLRPARRSARQGAEATVQQRGGRRRGGPGVGRGRPLDGARPAPPGEPVAGGRRRAFRRRGRRAAPVTARWPRSRRCRPSSSCFKVESKRSRTAAALRRSR